MNTFGLIPDGIYWVNGGRIDSIPTWAILLVAAFVVIGAFAIGNAIGKDNAIRRYSNGRDDGSQLKGDAYRQGYTDGWNAGRAPSGRDWSPTEGNP